MLKEIFAPSVPKYKVIESRQYKLFIIARCNLHLLTYGNFLGNNTPLGCTSQFAKTIEGNDEEEKSGVVKDIVGHVERGP